jgi:predicted dehydrogenase
VPLPTALHCEQVLRALASGKHVLVEKPFSANAQQAARMVDAARARGLMLMEAMHWYYHPFRERARAVVASGIIGAVRRVEVSVKITMPQSAKSINASRYNIELGGGATLDVGSYALSCMVALLGDGELPRVTRATATR